ncbi:MAG: phosphatidylserine decarboxylase family protein [Alphaproteobacteria bacterium]|nr:MAG: phosphatidylserine decarboxylase family protein [Alphaproteobacteria bacterium]
MNADFIDSLKKIRDTLIPPIHPAGWPFIVGFAFATILMSLIWCGLGLFGLFVTIWCFYFFRDPARVTPQRDGLVIAPACGTISHITPNVPLPKELDKAKNKKNDYTRVSTFLNVFNVHVNRFPITGKVIQKTYQPGAFVNAAFDKASEENERASLLFEVKDGKKTHEMAVVQIAGWVARRILNDAKEKQAFKSGERFGIIRFGSRVDVYLPKGVSPLVAVGQSMIEGETVMADLSSKETLRKGNVL